MRQASRGPSVLSRRLREGRMGLRIGTLSLGLLLVIGAIGCGGGSASGGGSARSSSFIRDCVTAWNAPTNLDIRRQFNASYQSQAQGGGSLPVLVTRYNGPPVEDAAIGSAVDANLANVT